MFSKIVVEHTRESGRGEERRRGSIDRE